MKLTADEIKLVAFLMAAVVLGIAVKHHRHRGEIKLPPAAAAATPAPKGQVDFE